MDRHTKKELAEESLARVRNEIVAERAAALSRITRTLERQLERLHHIRSLLPSTERSKRAKHIATYEKLRESAATYRWYLAVQREVNGLHDGNTLDTRYPIPGPIATGDIPL